MPFLGPWKTLPIAQKLATILLDLLTRMRLIKPPKFDILFWDDNNMTTNWFIVVRWRFSPAISMHPATMAPVMAVCEKLGESADLGCSRLLLEPRDPGQRDDAGDESDDMGK